jgi:hypothetical protein
MSITLKSVRIHHGSSGPFRVRHRGPRIDRRHLMRRPMLADPRQADERCDATPREPRDALDRFLAMVDAAAPGRPQPIRGQRRRAFEVRTSDIRARIGRTTSRSKIRNSWRVSDTASQISENSIWASIEFRTRGAIPFAPGADGIACHRARPSRLILSIQDSYQTSLFALPWLNGRSTYSRRASLLLLWGLSESRGYEEAIQARSGCGIRLQSSGVVSA